MRKSLPLLLCLLLSVFTVTRAANRAHTFVPKTKSAEKSPAAQQAGANGLFTATNTEEEEPSSDDDQNSGDASDDEGENPDDDGGDATGDDSTADDDEGDDDGTDDGGGSVGQ